MSRNRAALRQKTRVSGRIAAGCSLAVIVAAASPGATAQTVTPDQAAGLRQQLDDLRTAQAQISARIGQLEATLQEMQGVETLPPPVIQTAQAPPANPRPATDPNPLTLSGDFRVRYETNQGDADAPARNRGVLRARGRASYAVTDNILVAGQISTGDPDDPNTADVTLSNWDDDLAVSLDQIYARLTFGDLVLTAGKIPQPFRRTDLVWDGDVSPQGIAADYRISLPWGGALKASGLLFEIDEVARGPNSNMAGGQIEFASPPGPTHFELAAGYYDYRLHSLVGADSGDTRSNLMLPSGGYLSDFDLLDVVGSLTFGDADGQWPVQLVGNYVQNLGAAVDADTAYGIDAFVGRAAKLHDWRIGYGFARAEVDAVLAAFSHDNIDIATNYLLHALSLDYVPADHTLLNLTWYHYRPLQAAYAGPNTPDDWLDRIRLNFSVNF